MSTDFTMFYHFYVKKNHENPVSGGCEAVQFILCMTTAMNQGWLKKCFHKLLGLKLL
jgi:hypothetical protein